MKRRDLLTLPGRPRLWLPGRAGATAARRLRRRDLDRRRPRRPSLPVRLRWPAGDGPCALVIHSHGLGGSRAGGAAWGEAWQAAGLAVLHLQHPGSDTARSARGRAARLRASAASAEQYLARVADARFVLDEIERRRAAGGPWRARDGRRDRLLRPLVRRPPDAGAGRRDAAGAHPRAARPDGVAEPRPARLHRLQPGLQRARRPGRRRAAAQRFGAITRPFLCHDRHATTTRCWSATRRNAARRAVYRGLPAGHKAAAGARRGRPHDLRRRHRRARARRRPRRCAARPARGDAGGGSTSRVVAAISADWWRWRLLGDAAAAAAPARARPGLAAADLWQQG